jgi:hypothetical protein
MSFWALDVYEDAGYGGGRWSFLRSSHWVGDDCNDKMTSFHVDQNYNVIFYANADYNQPLRGCVIQPGSVEPPDAKGLVRYPSDCPGVNPVDNDVMSSLRIYKLDGTLVAEFSQPPQPPPAPAPVAGNHVVGCSVYPQRIGVGGRAVISVQLSQPAPPGGATVVISTNFVQGSQDTLQQTPQSVGVMQGSTTGRFTLISKQGNPTAHSIIFTASYGGQQRSVQLDIS